MKVTKEERQQAIDWLREQLKPGDTVSTILRHVSRSGMQRRISCIINTENGPFDADYWVSKAIGVRLHEKGGIVMGGCGMDMGFHLVYMLSHRLWPDGFDCVGDKRCRSNDHFNGDRNYTPHRHQDGGYALSQRWL
jgi:macrodomain Ter protein organizer (MatP/YcbG family)